MFEMFVFGTFWFWALIVAEISLLFIFVSNENGIGAFVSMIAFACCLQFLGDTDILKMVMENPMWVGVIAAGYVALSVPWGTFRWTMFCRDRLEEYEDKIDYLNVMRSEHRRDVNLWLRYLGEQERLKEKKLEVIEVDWKREGF